MIIGLGVDLLEVQRVEDQLRQDGPEFVRQVFTPDEIAYCESQRYPARHYAARFAVKEAVLKALAVDGREGALWRQVELRARAGGREVMLLGRVKELAEGRSVRRVSVSLSHTPALATATIILES